MMARLLASKQEILEGCRQILDEVLTTDEQSRQIAKLQDQAVGLAQRIRGLVNENAKTQMTEDEFTPEYDRLVGQYEKLAARIATIQREKENKEYRAKRISLFMRMLAGQEECLRWCSWRRWLSAGRKRACILHLKCQDALFSICDNHFAVDPIGIQRNAGIADVLKAVLCTIIRDDLMEGNKLKNGIHDILCREITEKARQVNPVGDILDGVEAIEGEYTAQYAGVAHDASLFHGGERVLQEAWADEIEGFGDAVDLAGEPAIVQHSFVRF